jgi:hypothetical protein
MVRLTVSALLVLALLPATAAAAPPANDNRVNAQSLDPLPTTVSGTTAEATREENETFGGCGDGGPSVWYSATAAQAGRIGVRTSAGGDLDYAVDVFKRVRSQLTQVECDSSDGQGNAALNFRAAAGDRYLIRIVQREESVAGSFALRVSAPFAPATPPGKLLPKGGATSILDRAEHVDDAWSVVLRTGVTYRLRLSGRLDSCRPHAEVYLPGTSSFDDDNPVHRIGCGRSLTFTPRPGESGRYPIRVVASSSARRPQGYHLEAARAGVDDTSPGVPIHNHRRARGVLRGDHVDAVDLYRFVIAERSRTALTLTSQQQFSLVLVDDEGHRLGRGGTVDRILRPGTYFVGVRAIGSASGRYRLRRDSRVLTHLGLQALTSGGVARLLATVSPAESGPVRILVERFDPLVGWLFADQFSLRAVAGRAAAGFSGSQGRYRAEAEFLGTRDAASSTARSVRFRLRAS